MALVGLVWWAQSVCAHNRLYDACARLCHGLLQNCVVPNLGVDAVPRLILKQRELASFVQYDQTRSKPVCQDVADLVEALHD